MRYNKLIAATLVALFTFGAVAPALAGDGRPPKFADISIQDHPWQDDNNKDGGRVSLKPFHIVFGPWIINIGIPLPIEKKPSTATAPDVKPAVKQTKKGK
jgi:hypothetical protein